MRQTAGVTVSWLDWFIGFAPVGFTLARCRSVPALQDLSARDSQCARGAALGGRSARAMGTMSRRELTLLVLVCCALAFVDRRDRSHRAGNHGHAGRAADGDVPRRVVERRDRTRAGVEHPDLVCDDGHAGGRAGRNEVRRLGRAVARPDAAGFQLHCCRHRRGRRRVLLPALLLCEHHGAYGEPAARVPRNGGDDSRSVAEANGRCCWRIRSDSWGC